MKMKFMVMFFSLGENCLQTSWGFKEIEVAFLLAKLFIASYPALYSASGMRSLGEGLWLQTEQGTLSGAGSQKQLLLSAERCHGRQESAEPWNCWEIDARNLFLAEMRSALGGCKGFLTQFAGCPRLLSTTLGVPAMCGGKGQQSWCSAAISLTSARPCIQSAYSVLSSGKAVVLLWEWWHFPDLFSHESMKGQGERGGRSTAAAPQGDLWLLNKAVTLQMAESSQLLFLPSRAQLWKLHCVSLPAGKFILIFFGFS